MVEPLKVVTLGGGTGHYALLRALKLIPNVDITAVVSVADSGGSSGELRDTHGGLPPGDILKAILALSEMHPELVREFMLHRFDEGKFAPHTIGNMLLTMHATQVESMQSAIDKFSAFLLVEHRVVPVSLANISITAHYSDGSMLVGEGVIDEYRGEASVKELVIEPDSAYICRAASQAIRFADVVIIAPGSLYTSLLPVLQMGGVADVLQQSKALKIFVCNTMTLNGDTRGFCVSDFIERIEAAMGCKLDRVLVDSSDHEADVLERYAQQFQFPVTCTAECLLNERILEADLVATGELVRHDYAKLSQALQDIMFEYFNQPVPIRRISSVRSVSKGRT